MLGIQKKRKVTQERQSSFVRITKGHSNRRKRKEIIEFLGEKNGLPKQSIFYAVSKPLKISETLASSALSADSPEFLEVKADKFEKYSDSFTIGSTDGAVVFYKVRAFAKDKKGNVSNCSEFSVVIDEDNYYLDSSEVAGSLENEVEEDCDGTAENPAGYGDLAGRTGGDL